MSYFNVYFCTDEPYPEFQQMYNVFKMLQSLQQQILELKQAMQLFKSQNDALLQNMIAEIMSLKRSDEISESSVIPRTPFKTVAEFENYEDNLKNSPELAETLEAEFCIIAIYDPVKFLRTAWRQLLSKELCKAYSWCGTRRKQSIQLFTVTNVLRAAFAKRFGPKDDEFDIICMRWFQSAGDRCKQKHVATNT